MLDLNPAFDALVHGVHGDPFALLGPHGNVVRALLPGAVGVRVISRKSGAVLGEMRPVYDGILFDTFVETPEPYCLSIDWGGGVQVTEGPVQLSAAAVGFRSVSAGGGAAPRSGRLPRRSGDDGGRRGGGAVRALGTECAAGFGGRRFQ